MNKTESNNEGSTINHNDMANAIRALSMDAVEAANSGHPGMPMGMADVATILYTKFLSFDSSNPEWPDRDRFILSAGHGSMLLYSLLYLTGYPEMTIEEIKNFRQLGSKCAGHPEYGHAPGIETTTGPLGQGIANAVGMAMAEKHMAANFGDDLVNHYTYVIAGDGCLMEGISHEAISMAGHLSLGKLIVFFDDNQISIDGSTSLATSDNQLTRAAASNWHTLACDGHNPSEIEKCISEAQTDPRPSIIACRTTIAYGSPNKAGTAAAHGAALGPEEVAATRKQLGWPHAPFIIPENILNAWRLVGKRSTKLVSDWQNRLQNSSKKDEFIRRLDGELPNKWANSINEYKKKLASEAPGWASRKSSQEVLEVINPITPETIGGSADLSGSNLTLTKDLGIFSSSNYKGRYIHYGVREHAMAASMNGMALHGGIIPYGGTFLVFTDYLRPSLRLAALMKTRVIFVMTHDSIGLGEDGPTHQPVETIASIRCMPNVLMLRPCDAVETLECWQIAIENDSGPSVLALSRQGLPALRTNHTNENLCSKGAYEISPAADGKASVSLLATGSEVSIGMEAQKILAEEGISARVVSVPSFELLEKQSKSERDITLGTTTLRVAIEAMVPFGWDRLIGPDGGIVSMNSFGASAPAEKLYEHFGISAKNVVETVKRHL